MVQDRRLQVRVVPASQKDPDGWGLAHKFTLVLETAGLNAAQQGGHGRERELFPEQVDRWRRAAQDANAQSLPTTAEQKDLEKRHQADQREIQRQQQELRRKDKSLASPAALLESRLEELGGLRSFSRPRVSNANPYSESLFRTA